LYLAEEGNVAKTEERGNALQGEENPGGKPDIMTTFGSGIYQKTVKEIA
jgi:hypothetical protein